MSNGSHHHRISPDSTPGVTGSVNSTPDSDATPADAAPASKGVVRRFAGSTPRMIRNFVLVLGLLFALGAGAAASASADGTIVAMKGGDRNLNDDTVEGATNYTLPLSGVTFEYTTDNTLPQDGWTDFDNQSAGNGQATTSVAAGTYYVREKTVGANFTNFGPVQSLFFDPNDGSPNSAEPYVARVTVSDNLTTYAYPHTNNSGTPSNWTPTPDRQPNEQRLTVHQRQKQRADPRGLRDQHPFGTRPLRLDQQLPNLLPGRGQVVRKPAERHPDPDRDNQLQLLGQLLQPGDRELRLLQRAARSQRGRQRGHPERQDRQHLRRPERQHQLGRGPSGRLPGQELRRQRGDRPDD